MQGLKTQESQKFKKFWDLVQRAANDQGKTFFLDCGEGREFFLDDIEGEDLRGWLIPLEKTKEFESEWEKGDVSNKWEDNIFWAEWTNKSGAITIEFNTY